jgi:hypothetical protein
MDAITNRIKRVGLAVLAAGAIGCSDAPTIKDAPVAVSGKVSQAGKPVGNVVVWFHPLDSGHLQSLSVNTDGTFAGELIGGNYSYYVGKPPAASSAVSLKGIDPKYYEPDLERTINVEFGKEILLALD